MTAGTIWIISLIIGLVVIGVVALLLNLITKAAREINEAAGEIWTEGKLTANNTIQIPLFLQTTNQVAGEILATAGDIVVGAKMIEEHAIGCPGCPACMLEHKN